MQSELPVDDVEKSQIARALGPMWVIDKRLAYHAHPDHTDRLLSGLRFDREGKITNIGERDLPFASVIGYTENETYGVGHPGTKGPFVEYTGTLTIMVSAKRDYGLMLRDPAATGDSRYIGVGALEWLQKVKDAIETTADDPPAMDWTLEGTVLRPCLFNTGSADVSMLAWSFMLEVTLHIEQIARASRSPEAGYIFHTVSRNPLSM